MRISPQAKAETRSRIVDAGRDLFAAQGFGRTTTRDLSRAAGIAAGTLFNYFSTKESLAMAILAEALENGWHGFAERRRGEESLREDLFAHVAAGLRELEDYRLCVGEVIEAAMSPFTRSSMSPEGDRLRAEHLERVQEILAIHGHVEPPGFVAMHLYWTLYLGVLAFWSSDGSPNQGDTLVVLDQSLEVFVNAFGSLGAAEGRHGA